MPNIKSISDLRNYNEVLRIIEVGSRVFLTKMVVAAMWLWISRSMKRCRHPLNCLLN